VAFRARTFPDYFFFRVLQWRETCNPRDLTPLLTTTLLVSSVFDMNVLTVVFGLQPIIGPWVSYGPPLYLLVGVLVFGVVHLLWVNNDRYAPLAAMFSDETASQRKLRTGLLYGYVVLSVLIPLVVAIATSGPSKMHD
jgi:hypothetical protein